MHWLDLAIVYFAFGAPFGVFQITARGEISLSACFTVTTTYLLWPLVAIQRAARFFFVKPVPQIDDLDTIRLELEKTVLQNLSTKELIAFREVFYRYAGLSQAANETPKPLNNSVLLNIAGNANRVLREACISRRDREKLTIQLERARQDLTELISATEIKNVDETIPKVAKLRRLQ